MFLIIDNNDINDTEKHAENPIDVYDLCLDYYYESAGQELEDAISNAIDAMNWASSANYGDNWHGGDLTVECVRE